MHLVYNTANKYQVRQGTKTIFSYRCLQTVVFHFHRHPPAEILAAAAAVPSPHPQQTWKPLVGCSAAVIADAPTTSRRSSPPPPPTPYHLPQTSTDVEPPKRLLSAAFAVAALMISRPPGGQPSPRPLYIPQPHPRPLPTCKTSSVLLGGVRCCHPHRPPEIKPSLHPIPSPTWKPLTKRVLTTAMHDVITPPRPPPPRARRPQTIWKPRVFAPRRLPPFFS